MNNKLKERLKKTVFYLLWKKIHSIAEYYKSDEYYFKNKCFPIKKYGKLNKDKILFVINDANPHSGILSEWFRHLAVLNFCFKNGYTPVVDLQNYYMPLIGDKESVGKENCWDFYFKQPNEAKFSEVYKSSKVIIGPNLWNENYNLYEINKNEWSVRKLSNFPKNDLESLKYYYKITPLADDIKKMGDDYINEFFPKKNEKILGVSFRREYERNHVYNNPTTPPGSHPIKATLETIIT